MISQIQSMACMRFETETESESDASDTFLSIYSMHLSAQIQLSSEPRQARATEHGHAETMGRVTATVRKQLQSSRNLIPIRSPYLPHKKTRLGNRRCDILNVSSGRNIFKFITSISRER